MNRVAEIRPYLYLGGAPGRTEDFLRSNGITLVVNAEGDNPALAKCIVPQFKINAEDNPKYNLSQHFDKVADEIKKEIEAKGKIYIHCIGGISRAPSLTMVYLMKHEKMSLLDAHTLVRSKRSIIRPNPGFWKQLVAYETTLFGKNTVEMRQHEKGAVYPSVYAKDYENLVVL